MKRGSYIFEAIAGPIEVFLRPDELDEIKVTIQTGTTAETEEVALDEYTIKNLSGIASITVEESGEQVVVGPGEASASGDPVVFIAPPGTAIVNPPAEFPINTDVLITLSKDLSYDTAGGPDLGLVEVLVTATPAAPPGCSITPLEVVQTVTVAPGTTVGVLENFTVNCSQPSWTPSWTIRGA